MAKEVSWSLFVFFALALTGVATNLSAAFHVVKYLGVRKVISGLVLCDAVVGVLSLATHSVLLVAQLHAAGPVLCAPLFISGALPLIVGQLTTAQVAFIR